MSTFRPTSIKAAAWVAATTAHATIRATRSEAFLMTNTEWHGAAYCDEDGWPTIEVGEVAVVDFARGYESGMLLVQVTGPNGDCYEDEVNPEDAAGAAVALLADALAE